MGSEELESRSYETMLGLERAPKLADEILIRENSSAYYRKQFDRPKNRCDVIESRELLYRVSHPNLSLKVYQDQIFSKISKINSMRAIF